MKFDTPATSNPIDQLKVVGKAVDRVDGPLKTTGTAAYANDRHDVAANQAHGYIVGAAIAKGRIVSMDLTSARAAPGVLAIVTAENAGKLGKGTFNTAHLLGGPDIQHYHQAVAVVVAETFEQARAAAHLVRVEYARAQGVYDLAAATDSAKPVESNGAAAETAVGDFTVNFAQAPVQLDASYSTADESHSMIEPFASVAAWNGDQLTLWTANQMIAWTAADAAKTLGIPADKVRVASPFIGGGFGAKLWLRADALLAALGARAARRPVRVAMPRALIPNNTVHRAATIQRIRIGADRDGKITAIAHESWSGNLPEGGPEAAAIQTRSLYAGPHRMTANRISVLDLPEANAMRAPNEAPGLAALEIAMDEMAEKLGMDPVAFRIANDTQVVPDNPAKPASNDPQSKAPTEKHNPHPPFSQRQLVECFRLGARRFGWDKRNPLPGRVRDGRWLVGLGVAAAIRDNLVMKSGARVRLDRRGFVTVESDMTDIGTGSYTVIAQTAAEMMGVRLERVVVKLGDSTYPISCGSGGQWGGNSSTAGVYAACMKLREAVAQKAGLAVGTAVFANGQIRAGSRSIPLGEVAGDQGIVAEDAIEFGDLNKQFQQATFGAHFVEVGVDAATGETRVRRMLAVCAAGRILNPKTARSQVIGGMTMGVGAALMEELAVDKRLGLFVNHDLAGYEVPVHADIPHQEVIFLDEVDPTSSPMKAKGVGELGICGAAAAVANAVYNATGVRVRDYPITLDKLLKGLPAI
ncbi:xanthine dehydrogenase family protein molybdopterin-binding subunit [Caenimonas sedimenti]|uniref:Xanthine dehydrogenase family protein molybdopterin-binding subunit n=1 Tax=Caenimonas sedimenti TaxID=2596921 RepID=A0A562ZX64_9BURK|nr:aldehyde oxidoreductase molybdenum-binding subunit PaoC [Caenimonas sedimenti]TWO72885.1 xanthine dehydrogenase family protein molybdopterin-binding subunit [Caenimonas sedimenti]